MIRPQHAQRPRPSRRVRGDPDGSCSVKKHGDMNRRRRTPAPAVFVVDCGGGIQAHLSTLFTPQTAPPASTVVAPTLQLKLILFSSRREKSMDTRSPGRTGWTNLADLICHRSRPLPRSASIARKVSLNSTAPGMIGLSGKCPLAAA